MFTLNLCLFNGVSALQLVCQDGTGGEMVVVNSDPSFIDSLMISVGVANGAIVLESDDHEVRDVFTVIRDSGNVVIDYNLCDNNAKAVVDLITDVKNLRG